jgi:hypothetical protein
MIGIVSPGARERLVVGRPKARAAGVVCFLLGGTGVLAGLIHPEWQDSEPLIGLLGASALSGAVAVVLRFVERPRKVVTRTGPHVLGPIIHLTRGPAAPSTTQSPAGSSDEGQPAARGRPDK